MERQIAFHIQAVTGDRTQFASDEITIITGAYSSDNGKHLLADPQAASAYFVCCGQRYMVDNTGGIATVEEWYLQELLPRFQMLGLLGSSELFE